MAATIAEAEPQAQADWLWDNYAEHTGAAPLERGDFGGAVSPLRTPSSMHLILCSATYWNGGPALRVTVWVSYLPYKLHDIRVSPAILPFPQSCSQCLHVRHLKWSAPCTPHRVQNCRTGDPRWRATVWHVIRVPVLSRLSTGHVN